jgi:hypothetical protein
MVAVQLPELDLFLVSLGILKIAPVTEARSEPPTDHPPLRPQDERLNDTIEH